MTDQLTPMASELKHAISKRLTLLRWASWYSTLTAVLIALFALNFSRYMPGFDSWFQPLYVGSALLGHFSSLCLLLILFVLLPLIILLPAPRIIKGLLIAAATLASTAIVLDYQVYTQYRFHINGVLLNLIIEDGGEEIFVFSWVTWLQAGLALLAILLMQLLLAWLVERRMSRPGRGGGLLLASLCAGAFIGSHATHIWADANYDQRITSLTRHIPFYYPTTAKGFLQKRGWADLDKNRELAQQAIRAGAGGGDRSLNYPRSPIECPAPAQPLNVLMIVVDSWRFDEMDDRTTPFVQKLSEESDSLQFNRHYSGGNSTKSGIFSLFYGLPSSYWTAMSAGLTGPVMIDQFAKADYQFGIFASAKLTHPAFDRNVFAAIPNLRTSSDGENTWQKDQDITADWAEFLAARDPSRPFFGFLFYDATHAYTYPPGFPEPFDPMWKQINHLELNADFDPLPYLNRHRTSVLFVDSLIERAVSQLREQGLYDNTVIIVTADHGEEFNDNGQNYWGHGSNYTDAQTRVPLIIRWPGKASARFDGRTSHMDIASTLMDGVLGCSAPAADYSIGRNLFDQSPREWLYSGSYYNYAIMLEDSILVTYPTGNYEFLGTDNRPAPDQRLDPKLSLEVLQALSRFYQ